MTVKVGDTVRYLNAIGGGVVTRFQSKDVILVEEDGFESPVLVRDVVVVQATNEYNFPVEDLEPKSVSQRNKQKNADVKVVEEVVNVEPEYTWNEREETAEGENLNLYLAFIPRDVKKLQNGELDLYVVNDSNYYMQFALYGGKDVQKVLAQNVIEPQTKLFLGDIPKEELGVYEHIRVQAFAYKRIEFKSKPSIDFMLRIQPVKFYKLHSYAENDFFDEKAMMVTIVENDVMNFEMLIDPNELQKAINSKDVAIEKKVEKKGKRPDVIEVDLHIHELMDDVRGLSRFDMLQVQIGKFNEVMQENLKFRGQKIVFIHGKGEGILRVEIEKELKKKYKQCRFYDASFQQYGFGATQVVI